MKTSIFILLAFVCMQSCCAQQNKTVNQSLKKDTIMEQQYGIPEKYDFESAQKHGVGTLGFIKNEWLIAIGPMDKEGGWSAEYAPAKGFYVIGKSFYPNGMMRLRTKILGGVNFGIYEEFNDQGKLVKIEDLDKKFGKIKPKDIIEFLEKEGWFNRETGENKIAEASPLPTNGNFYKSIMRFVSVYFISSQYSKTGIPYWEIEIEPQFNGIITRYVIDGETGAFEKEIKHDFRTE